MERNFVDRIPSFPCVVDVKYMYARGDLAGDEPTAGAKEKGRDSHLELEPTTT
jgi:hypothetical protein